VSDVDIQSVNANVKFFTGVYKYSFGYKTLIVLCFYFLQNQWSNVNFVF